MNILEKSITKVIALVIVISMIFTLTMPTAFVLAETGDSDPGTGPVSINGKYYDTLQEAVNNVGNNEIIVLNKDVSGSGVKVASGNNFTVDFKGHTYDIEKPTVGSTGTETNGFQLLRDSNIVMKDGKITSDDAKILIQNYSNLTLNDMTLDGEHLVINDGYTLSNNHGDVNIIGNTSITAKEGAFAFDVYYWPPSYNSVNVTVDTSGKIKGNIEYDSSSKDQTAIASNSSLKIKKIDLDGDILARKTGANINITGGTYTDDPTNYLEEGYKASFSDGNYVVSDNREAKIGDTYYTTFKKAIEEVKSGEAIELLRDIEVDGSNVGLNQGILKNSKNITINGNDNTIKFVGTATQTVGLSMVGGAQVTINDLIVDGNNKIKHGVQTAESGTKATLNNVTSMNCTGYGVVANGSGIVANNVNTEGNGWGGIDVGKGKGVIEEPALTFNGGTIKEENQINANNVDKTEVSEQYVKFGASAGTWYSWIAGVDDNNTTVTLKWTQEQPAAKIGNVNFITLDNAIKTAKAGDKIVLNKDINVDMGTDLNGKAIGITKNITLDGQGHKITATKAGDASNGMGSIVLVSDGAEVTIKNLTVDGNNKAARHGIQAYAKTDSTKAKVFLENVTAENCFGYGIMVNGAELSASGLTTQNNDWGGVNVTQGSGVTAVPEFTLSSGAINENNKIQIDNSKNANLTGIATTWVKFNGVEKDNWHSVTSSDGKKINYHPGALITGVDINVTKTSIYVGDKEQLSAKVIPSNAYSTTITWSSINSNVASVSEKGVVTAQAEGKTTITALAADGYKAECIVNVVKKEVSSPAITTIEPVVDEGASLDEDESAIIDAIKSTNEGEVLVIDLPASVNNVIVPANIIEAAKTESDNGGSHTLVIQTHESGNGSIPATFALDLSQVSGTIVPFQTGITVTADPSEIISDVWPASNNAKTLAITLAHEGNFPAPVQITLPISNSIASPGDTIYLYHVKHNGGDSLELVGNSGIVVAGDNTITFTLSHASDYVVASAPANATAVKMNKSSVSLKMKDTTALKATLTPAEAIDTVRWTSSNAKVAKVDQNGKVTALTPGTATITASTGNNIKATCKVTVAPLAKPTLKVKSTGYKKVKASWSKVSLATDYQLYRATSKNGKYKKVKTTKGLSFTNKKLKTGKTYYYKVRSYVKVGNTTVYSAFTSPKKVKPIPATPKLKVKAGKGSMKATWKKVDGAAGYKIYRAKSKNGKFVKIRNASKNSTSFKSSNKKSGKTYYYKMRAYTKVGGKTVYSKYAEVIKVKVK